MADDIQERIPVTPKSPQPICTLMSDGTFRVERDQVPLIELQRMLLGAVAMIGEQTLGRAVTMERTLSMIRERYDGFGPEVDDAITRALTFGPQPAPPSPPPSPPLVEVRPAQTSRARPSAVKS